MPSPQLLFYKKTSDHPHVIFTKARGSPSVESKGKYPPRFFSPPPFLIFAFKVDFAISGSDTIFSLRSQFNIHSSFVPFAVQQTLLSVSSHYIDRKDSGSAPRAEGGLNSYTSKGNNMETLPRAVTSLPLSLPRTYLTSDLFVFPYPSSTLSTSLPPQHPPRCTFFPLRS